MKIGMYTDDEILEHLTDGEGRGFLGRSMYDAIMEEIERLNNIINELEKDTKKKLELAKEIDNEEEQRVFEYYLDKLKELLKKGNTNGKD